MDWITSRALNGLRVLRTAGGAPPALVLLLLLPLLAAAPGPAAAKYASIVIAADTGEVLRSVNADTRNYPASLTKMMTLYLAFEALEGGRLGLDDRLPVSRHAASMPPSKLGLRPGETIRFGDAILALVTKSANDAAVVVAEALGGTEWGFAKEMTAKARALGMTRTTFRTASGLHHRGQLSTARDMARLARALLRDFPQYYDYFSTREFRYAGRVYRNHNHLLEAYAGTDGIKTGYTRPSGFNLAASAVRGGRRLIAVVFGGRTARSRDRHMVTLLDRGFARLATVAEAAPEIVPSPSNPRRGVMVAAAPDAVDAAPLPAPRKPESPAAEPLTGIEEVVAAVLAEAEAGAEAAAGSAVEVVEAAGSAEHAPAPPPPYGVQVGAYYDADLARRAATLAVERLPHLLLDGEVDVSRTQGRRGWIYRGRLIGLTRGRAKDACRALRSMSQDCLVVRTGDGVEVALND